MTFNPEDMCQELRDALRTHHTHFTKQSVQEYGEHCRAELLKAGFTPKKGIK